MAEEFWNIFKENGDALCYLLYKAKASREATKSTAVSAANPGGEPSA